MKCRFTIVRLGLGLGLGLAYEVPLIHQWSTIVMMTRRMKCFRAFKSAGLPTVASASMTLFRIIKSSVRTLGHIRTHLRPGVLLEIIPTWGRPYRYTQ